MILEKSWVRNTIAWRLLVDEEMLPDSWGQAFLGCLVLPVVFYVGFFLLSRVVYVIYFVGLGALTLLRLGVMIPQFL